MSSTAQSAILRARHGPTHTELGLSEDHVLAMYRTMLLSRRVDERMWLLNRQGRAPFTISCQGHEGAQVGTAAALRRGEDIVLPYYRDVGVVLWMGMTARDLFLAFFAKAEDPASGGRQMPNHFGHARLRIISGSSPVGTQIPHAAGVALASKIRREPTVTATYFGDGTTSQGDFHEGVNFASIHRLPVVFICENNGYAISVPRSKQMATATVAERAAAYGIPGIVVDGSDVLAVYWQMQQAVERARRGEGPTLLDIHVQRFTPHSSDDDDRVYRPAEEIETCRADDPIVHFHHYLRTHNLLNDEHEAALQHEVTAEVDEAVAWAEQRPDPDPAQLAQHVFAESRG